MERIFKLQSKQIDEVACDIDGRTYVRVHTKEFDKPTGPLFFMNNGKFISRPLDEKLKEHEQIWRFNVLGAEPTGKKLIGKDEKEYDHTRRTAYFVYDDTVTEENYKTFEDKDFTKFFNYQVLKLLKNHAEVEFVDEMGRNKNPNTIMAKFTLMDITQQHELSVDKEMLAHELMSEIMPIFKNDYTQFEDICYGFGMASDITSAGNDRNKLYVVLSKLIQNDPAKFQTYYNAREYTIIVNKAIAKDVIKMSGNAYFINNEIAGSTPEQVENYLRLNTKSLSYVKMQLGIAESEKTLLPSDNGVLKFDRAELRNELKFPSQFKTIKNKFTKKYQDNLEASDELKKELLDICKEKGWTEHEASILQP